MSDDPLEERFQHGVEQLLEMHQPPAVSLVERHLGRVDVTSTRRDLAAILLTDIPYDVAQAEAMVDRLIDRLLITSRERGAGFASLLLNGVKDGRY